MPGGQSQSPRQDQSHCVRGQSMKMGHQKPPQTYDLFCFSLFPYPRVTLYIGKHESGFYVSEVLVHSGVALVVSGAPCGVERGRIQNRGPT